tara:strand:+ start:3752 stop:4459 length:708 start_codon:yes stop_codon:yes gene_type:complete
MASLSGRQISSTFKDILHVYNGTENQGLEVTTKRVFDGEGVGSPLYLGTDFIEVGTVNNADNSNFKVWGDGTGETQPYFLFNTSNGNVFLENGDLSVDGTVTADTFALTDTEDASTNVFTIDTSGTLQTTVPIKTTALITTESTILVKGTTGNDLKIDAAVSSLARGTDKGNVKLETNGVSLKKAGDSLFSVKDDGEITPKTLAPLDDFPSSPVEGSMAVKQEAGGISSLWLYNA